MSLKSVVLILFGLLLASPFVLFHANFYLLEPPVIVALLLFALLLPRYVDTAFTQRLALLCFIAVCLFSTLRFVQIAQLNPYHTHELYHYAIGGKYFSYLGYQHLYAASADVLLQHDIIDNSLNIRDLSNKSNPIDAHWQAKAKQVFATMPEDVRQAFTADILFFSEIFGNQPSVWGKVFHDHGFNPSPVWLLEAAPLLHTLPLPQLLAWVIFIDYALLFAIVLIIGALANSGYWRAATLAVFCFVFAYYPSVGFQSFIWITGSFLRYTWLFYVTLGMFLLIKQRYFWAGALLMLAGLERIFPLAFFGMAGLYLMLEFIKQASLSRLWHTPVVRFSVGGFSTIVLCLMLYTAFYPNQYLHTFVDHIQAHHSLTYLNSVGYKDLVVHSDTDRDYDLWHKPSDNIQQNGSSEYLLYIHKVQALRYHNNLAAQILKITLLILFALIAFQFMNLPSAVLFGGTAIIYYFTTISSYYLIFIALNAAFAVYQYQQNPHPGERLQLVYWLMFIAAVAFAPLLQYDYKPISLSQAFGLWFLLPLLASTYLLPRWYQQLGVFAGLGLALFILLLPNHYETPAQIPPMPEFVPLVQLGGDNLQQTRPDLPKVSHTYFDKQAQRITDSGVVLFEGDSISFSFNLAQPAKQDFSLILRSNFSYSVKLALSVNQQSISEQSVKKVGVFWKYATFKIPASALHVGKNTLQLHLKNGRALGIYHLWGGYVLPEA